MLNFLGLYLSSLWITAPRLVYRCINFEVIVLDICVSARQKKGTMPPHRLPSSALQAENLSCAKHMAN